MIEESVRVIEVQGDSLLLEAQTQSSCGSCQAKTHCGTATLSSVLGKKFVRFSVPNTVNAKVGDELIVGLPEKSLLSASFLVYLLPLLAMMVSGLIVDSWLAEDTALRDLLVFAVSLTGFAAAIGWLRHYFSSEQTARNHTPVILRKTIV